MSGLRVCDFVSDDSVMFSDGGYHILGVVGEISSEYIKVYFFDNSYNLQYKLINKFRLSKPTILLTKGWTRFDYIRLIVSQEKIKYL